MVSRGHRNVVLKSLKYDSTRNFHHQIMVSPKAKLSEALTESAPGNDNFSLLLSDLEIQTSIQQAPSLFCWWL